MRITSRRTVSRLVSAIGAAGLTLAAAALTAGPAVASPSTAGPARGSHDAVFVQTDNTAGNAVVAYDRRGDGSLVKAGTYPTGGHGGVLDGSAVDHTASQGALVLDQARHLLYAVNAGSDTITVFSVSGDRLTRRQVISSGGDFPVSIAIHGNLVYVLNARGGGSIQGYARLGDRLIRVLAWHRGLGLDAGATPEFTHTPGQVAFTPDGSKLIVTTKANGNDIDVYAIDRSGRPSAHPTVNREDGTVPFAVAFDPRGRLVVVEAGPSAVATFTIRANGRLTPLDQALTGQAASCWVVADGNRFYVSNAGSASVSGYTVGAGGGLHALGDTATDAGTVDATVSADGRFLYVQTGGDGVVDAFRIGGGGALTRVGSVTVPGAAGGEGIVSD